MRYVLLCLVLSFVNSPSWGQRFIPLTHSTTSSYALEPKSSAVPTPLLDHSPATAEQPRTKVQNQTQQLLEMQASKDRPGRSIPMLGATAAKSWDRYLESFTHPIPERFDERVISESP